MSHTAPHLQVVEEVQRAVPGLLEMLREEATDGVRYVLWNVSDCMSVTTARAGA